MPTNSVNKPKFDLSLYLVTDRLLSQGRDIAWIVKEAVAGGVTIVQLREKDCSTREFTELAIRLNQLLSPFSIPLIINDRLDVALAADAAGLHIGQSDMPYPIARKIMGKNRIIGLSVESVDQAREAQLLDVDYIGISPAFGTQTKHDIAQPFGLAGIRQVCSFSKHPTVAIGGINTSNAADVIHAGVNGVAAVSAICAADEPMVAAQMLRRLVEQTRGGNATTSQRKTDSYNGKHDPW